MLFPRRTSLAIGRRLQHGLWPRGGWRRSVRYVWLRLCRTQASPHAIALGVAIGIFVAFIPVLGIQMTLAALLAYAVRGSLLAAVAGTFIGTPVTYPFMWIGSYRLGAWLLGQDSAPLTSGVERLGSLLASATGSLPGSAGDQMPEQVARLLAPIVKPLLVGSLVLGLAAAGVAYYGMVCVVGRWQAGRRTRVLS